jgi:hypothetical protein
VVTGSSVTVIEVDMNAGDESAVGFATVRASVAQASSIFYDTPRHDRYVHLSLYTSICLSPSISRATKLRLGIRELPGDIPALN